MRSSGECRLTRRPHWSKVGHMDRRVRLGIEGTMAERFTHEDVTGYTLDADRPRHHRHVQGHLHRQRRRGDEVVVLPGARRRHPPAGVSGIRAALCQCPRLTSPRGARGHPDPAHRIRRREDAPRHHGRVQHRSARSVAGHGGPASATPSAPAGRSSSRHRARTARCPWRRACASPRPSPRRPRRPCPAP